ILFIPQGRRKNRKVHDGCVHKAANGLIIGSSIMNIVLVRTGNPACLSPLGGRAAVKAAGFFALWANGRHDCLPH
ncbi:MAG: hypothetical protein V3S46_02335, partial [Nitrospinota bacterium]